MKKNIKVIYLISLLLFIVNLIFYLMIKVIPSDWNKYLVITFLLFLVIFLRLYFGKYSNKSYYTGYIVRTVVMVLMAIGIIIYLLGLIVGFSTGYSYSLNTLLYSIIPIVLVTTLIEYLRYIVVKFNYDNIRSTLIFTILLSLLEIFFYLNIGVLTTSYKVFVFISVTVLPIITENYLCTYLTYNSDIKASLIFRLVSKLYIYILPIVPNLGDYLNSFVKLFTPFVIFYIVNRTMVEENRNKRIITKNSLKVFSIPIIIVLLMVVMLVSGIFNSRLIAIASDSMAPLYNRGDAVIYEKIDAGELKKGDILVFKKDNTIVTHRVVSIKKKGNEYSITTKGDANDSVDSFVSTNENVVGRVNYIIKYMGYPTVFFNELFERS